MLELKNIGKIFNPGTEDELKLFDNYSLSINKGEFVSVVGSNGSGKTTLLNIICGFSPIDSGSIIFNGKDITKAPEHKRAKFIGRVFQNPQTGTCPHLTVLENIALADSKKTGYGLSRAVNKKNIERYRSLLETCSMGLENKLNIKCGALSGGQRQALALVIACMTDIEMLILDEHTAALDPKSSERVMELTDNIIKEKNLTALMVTHNLRFATEYGSRLIMLHEGKNVMDLSGDEKQAVGTDSILAQFNRISIECGN